MNRNPVENIDDYIASCPQNRQQLLQEVRLTIQQAAPQAGEAIKYGMPTFTFNGNLVHFAACKNHLGFYPTPSAILAFADELSAYKVSKGAVQFPYTAHMPHELIRRMVDFRVKENTK
jgi:uncharacterized protein YdhG (YjbR/CyaY superfamily)